MNSWHPKQLGDVAKIYDGTHQTPDYVSDGVPFYSVEHLTSNDFSDTKYVSWDVYEKEIKRVKIEFGDILMTRIGDVGTARFIDWDKPASFYVSLALIKCGDEVESKFLSQLINSGIFHREIWGKTIHVAFPNKINLGDISKCRLLLPEKAEQQRIVSVLETWDDYLELLDRKIALKEQIKYGLIQQLLTGKKRIAGYCDKWRRISLGEVCDIKTGKKDVNESNPNGQYLFFSCSRTSTFSDVYSFDTEAIIVAGNGDVGHCRYFKGKFEAYQRTYVLSNFKNVSARYIFPFMQHYFQNFINAQKQMGAMPYIKLDMLKDYEITLPTNTDEQDEIVSITGDISEELLSLKRKKSYIALQKKYLLNNLITGKILTPENLITKGAN